MTRSGNGGGSEGDPMWRTVRHGGEERDMSGCRNAHPDADRNAGADAGLTVQAFPSRGGANRDLTGRECCQPPMGDPPGPTVPPYARGFARRLSVQRTINGKGKYPLPSTLNV